MKNKLSAVKKLISLLLIASSAAVAASCSESGSKLPENIPENTVAETSAESEAAEEGYKFAENYEGADFNVINSLDAYGMHSQIDREEETGEALNDAMYGRCRKLEEALNIKFIEYALESNKVITLER